MSRVGGKIRVGQVTPIEQFSFGLFVELHVYTKISECSPCHDDDKVTAYLSLISPSFITYVHTTHNFWDYKQPMQVFSFSFSYFAKMYFPPFFIKYLSHILWDILSNWTKMSHTMSQTFVWNGGWNTFFFLRRKSDPRIWLYTSCQDNWTIYCLISDTWSKTLQNPNFPILW